jgi:multidrug efflux pump subunit AcrB
MFDFFYKRPYLLYSIIAGLCVSGIYGLISMPKNLFPDSDRPTIVVMTQTPGATPGVVATTVSKPIEEEVSTLSLIRQVVSVNITGMSIVTAEFEYAKGLEAAAVDVSTAIAKVRGKLSPEANPSIYTSGSHIPPVDVFALSPANGNLTLSDIRKIAESDIKPAILRTGQIGNVEIFGGYQSAININVDPFKAKAYGVNLDKISSVLRSLDRDAPIGFSKDDNSFYTVTFYGEKVQAEELEMLPVATNVRLGDIATITWDYQKRLSGYIGNGKSAIALAIQRSPSGSVVHTSKASREVIEKLKPRYPGIHFDLADTQRTLIETSNRNMLEALRDAIIFTLLVLLLFLGNLKATIAALLSIPMVFFTSLAIIWLTGGQMDMVVYTAIILALGMLVDDAVVVLENVERHLTELKEDVNTAIISGTREVISPIFAGTIATITLLFPLLFVGDFPQQIYRPLASTLITALLASYFLSITFIPSISVLLYHKGAGKTRLEQALERIYEKSFGRLTARYVAILKFSSGGHSKIRRICMGLAALVVLAASIKIIMPVIGGDLMPPMDTGIIKARVKFSANETVEEVENRLKPFLEWVHGSPELVMSSITLGSEPGVLSLGQGSLPTEATMTINCVDRFHRKKNLWQIEDEIRSELAKLKHVKFVDVYDYGATAMSSIKAPVNVQLRAEDYRILPEAAHRVAEALESVRGLTSITLSWDDDFAEVRLNIDTNRALAYDMTPSQIISQLPLAGPPVAVSAKMVSMQNQFVRLYFNRPFDGNPEQMRLIPIQTPKGPAPLEALAQIEYGLTANKIERNQMFYSLDVAGYRALRPVSMLMEDVQAGLKKIGLKGVEISQEGDVKQMEDSFGRMIKAMTMGVILLFMALIAGYRSVRMAVVMILVLPLSMIGASWGMLIFHKPSCMPSEVGLLLLFGIIIKNSILLVDFYQSFRSEGASSFEAAIGSVQVRFRPVFMTAFGTIAGMIPIAAERAVGLERLAPLADVAIGGLLIGTILTLIYVPMLAYTVDRK